MSSSVAKRSRSPPHSLASADSRAIFTHLATPLTNRWTPSGDLNPPASHRRANLAGTHRVYFSSGPRRRLRSAPALLWQTNVRRYPPACRSRSFVAASFPANHRHRRIGRTAMGQQLGDDRRQIVQPHQDHQSVHRRRQLRPVDGRFGLDRFMAGDHRERGSKSRCVRGMPA